jgi:hypothetical protein
VREPGACAGEGADAQVARRGNEGAVKHTIANPLHPATLDAWCDAVLDNRAKPARKPQPDPLSRRMRDHAAEDHAAYIARVKREHDLR